MKNHVKTHQSGNQEARLRSLACDSSIHYSIEALPLAVIPGEGIGPELLAACQSVIDSIESNTDFRFDMEIGGKIGKEALAESGSSLTEEIVSFCQNSFSRGAPVLCGPGGDRFVYQLRRRFDMFCKFVPLKPLEALRGTGPMSEEAVRDVDILIVRDNVGGVYQGSWRTESTEEGLLAHHEFTYDERQVRRIIALGFAAAQRRNNKLCVVHKPGGTPAISSLWIDIAREIAADGSVDLRFLEVDTAAYLLLAEASTFDVVVTPNMFGDILADAAAVLLGSRGMSYSWNVSEKGDSVYQTGHGAAYDLAGLGSANPLGQIQTLAALLRESFGLFDISDAIFSACNVVLDGGIRTADIAEPNGAVVTTREMGDAIADELARKLSTSGREVAANLNH
jgi:3-isopropylmalate dehydrogenase